MRKLANLVQRLVSSGANVSVPYNSFNFDISLYHNFVYAKMRRSYRYKSVYQIPARCEVRGFILLEAKTVSILFCCCFFILIFLLQKC